MVALRLKKKNKWKTSKRRRITLSPQSALSKQKNYPNILL